MSVARTSLTLCSAGAALLGALSAQATPGAGKLSRPSLLDGDGNVIGASGGGGAGGKFGGRGGGRRRLVGRRGAVAEAIERGLVWLLKHQDADGGWNAAAFMHHDKSGRKSDGPGEGIGRAGITGFCLLPFLGDGSTLAGGPYPEVVHKGVEFLRSRQAQSGAYSKDLLEHAVATYAACEAAGLSQSSVLVAEVRAALAYLAAHQGADGGFAAGGKKQPSDSSTTLYAVCAYRSGLDFRIVEDRAPLQAVEAWLDRRDAKRGTPPLVALGVRSAETAMACRLLVGFFLGRDPKRYPAMVELADGIVAHLPADGSQGADPVFLSAAASSLYHLGGRYWTRCEHAIAKGLVETQRDDGNFAGSWDPKGSGGMLGGRLYATALAVLTAESYYRYTRLVR